MSSEWLTRNVCVVSQEPTLFARSIYRNIIYGLEGSDREPSVEEVYEAARQANAVNFIEVNYSFWKNVVYHYMHSIFIHDLFIFNCFVFKVIAKWI